MPRSNSCHTRSLAATASTLLLMACPVQGAPVGGQVVTGNATVAQSGASGQTSTTINQTSNTATINWQSFNVGSAESVNFVQPSASALAVNRILDTQGSQILGRINANGQVWLINPNGVLFGKDAQINVASLLATTLDVSDSSLGAAAGNPNATLRFSGNSTASVANLGTINAGQGGYVALIGHSATNQGTISAPGGTVALGAGSLVSLSFEGSKLLGLLVEQNQLNALALNGGLIQADGGQVLLSAGARDSLLASVVNNTGILQAQTVQEQAGRIVLLAGMAAGTTQVGGTLDASAPGAGSGGFIETSAHTVNVSDGARISTASAQGKQGQWLIDPKDFTIAPSGGSITGTELGEILASTDVSVKTTAFGAGGNGDITVDDAVAWSSGKTLTLNAYRNITINKVIDASAGAGGKLFLKYGQGSADGTIGGTASSYSINAPVRLQAGSNFATQLGSNGANRKDYAVITRLGSAGDENDASANASNSLQGLAYQDRLAGYYALGADIDAAPTANWNCANATNCSGFVPIGGYDSGTYFEGRLDGLGHTINNLTINRPSYQATALFGLLVDGGGISNLGLVDASIRGGWITGSLAAVNGGLIYNSYATGTLTADGHSYVGGLVGYNFDTGTISNSYAAIDVTSGKNPLAETGFSSAFAVGGLVGQNEGTIRRSHATGSVNDTLDRTVTYGTDTLHLFHVDAYVGGLVGVNYWGGVIDTSYATGNVTGYRNVGGLVGKNYAVITQSYAAGSVAGRDQVGGLVGTAEVNSSIDLSHATGTVRGTYSDSLSTGGLVGYAAMNVTITSSYATGNVTGVFYVGGLVGENNAAIRSSYASGNVSGFSGVGGLIGSNAADITNTYATGNVTAATNAGGLVGGSSNNSSISNSYASGTVTAVGPSTGGLVGGFAGQVFSGVLTNVYYNRTKNPNSNTIGTGLTSSQMLSTDSFSGFDFAGVWNGGVVRSPLLNGVPDNSPITPNDATAVNPVYATTAFGVLTDQVNNEVAYLAKTISGSSYRAASPQSIRVSAAPSNLLNAQILDPGVRLPAGALLNPAAAPVANLACLSDSSVTDTQACRVSSISLR